MVALRGKGDLLWAYRSNEAIKRSPLKFDSLHCVVRGLGYMVHPFQRGYVVGLHVANLVPYMYSVGVRCRAPGNASGDDPPVGSIEDMGIQLKGMETFPFPIL